ncbi:MAG: hypothetical protein R2747_00475 [Pyrinomonadaceae bacterium]
MNYLSVYTKFAIMAVFGLSVFSITAAADVKIRSRPTVSGQTLENTAFIKGKRQRTETIKK